MDQRVISYPETKLSHQKNNILTALQKKKVPSVVLSNPVFNTMCQSGGGLRKFIWDLDHGIQNCLGNQEVSVLEPEWGRNFLF